MPYKHLISEIRQNIPTFWNHNLKQRLWTFRDSDISGMWRSLESSSQRGLGVLFPPPWSLAGLWFWSKKTWALSPAVVCLKISRWLLVSIIKFSEQTEINNNKCFCVIWIIHQEPQLCLSIGFMLKRVNWQRGVSKSELMVKSNPNSSMDVPPHTRLG